MQSTGDSLDKERENIMKIDRTVMDSFNHSSTFPKSPEIGFGTGGRPALLNPTCTPGPASYQIKSTLTKTAESHIRSPSQFSIRTRTKFGDPNEKSMSKSNMSEPGPGQYDLSGKFQGGSNSRKSQFPKGVFNEFKPNLMPGPGAYGTWGSMGRQLLSTKVESAQIGFAKGERQSLVEPGASNVGPGEYGAGRAACDVQVESSKPSCGCIKIGTGYSGKKSSAERSRGMFGEPTPGPGSYSLPAAVGGKNSRAASLSGRNAFGSPFGK